MQLADKATSQDVIAINLLRAFAALGVYYYHSNIGATLAKYSGWPLLKLTDGFGATYSVPLFFLISGYCIHISCLKYLKNNQTLPLRQYYTRRFLRIYPAYLFALLFALIVNYATVEGYKFDSTDILIHLFSLQGASIAYFNTINVVLWTISVELAFYIIYPLFYFIRLKFNLNYALIFTLIISCISISYYIYMGKISLPERFCVFNLWFAWCCGAFLAEHQASHIRILKQKKFWILYAVIVMMFFYLRYVINQLDIVADQLNILFWTAPMMYFLTREDWLRKRKNSLAIKTLAAIGLSSYSLYLLHESLINLNLFLIPKYFSVRFQPLGIVLSIFIIPLVAWLSYLYIEKVFISNKRIPVSNE